MAANPSSSFQKNQANFPDPPKRGKLTAHILKRLANSVASSVSKAGKSLAGKLTAGGRGGGGSASSTPPTSAYNSDAS